MSRLVGCLRGGCCALVLFACTIGQHVGAVPPSVLMEKWGEDSLRIRMVLDGGNVTRGLPGALDERSAQQSDSDSISSSSHASVVSGNIKATWSQGQLVVARVSDGAVLMSLIGFGLAPCATDGSEGCSSKATLAFSSQPHHELYGTGQHMNTHGIPGRLPAGPSRIPSNRSSLPSTNMRNGSWDFESCTVYSDSSGAEICIPWILAASPPTSSGNGGTYEFGFLWNMPNFGSMTLETQRTAWVAHDPINNQVDFFVTTYSSESASGTALAAEQILSHYVDATGHSPLLPEWAAGYWHSPMGRPDFNQSEVIAAVDGLHARGIPTDLYVIDYFNWEKMGDYTFNPKYWPDPAAMVQHLESLGIRLMVSAWPYVLKSGARASEGIQQPGHAVHFENGTLTPWPDSVCDGECFLYDPSSEAGREFVWDMLDSGYVKYGVKNFWFDASEPESLANFKLNVNGTSIDYNNPLGQPQGSLFSAGSNQQVGMMFPWWHTKMVHDGLLKKFPDEVPVTLARSGWAGTQRFGAVNWNGDLEQSWEVFERTIVAGLNAQLSGIAWWTHDIGAIGGCNISDAGYRELLVRWFQYGLTSPIFRQHGSRPVEPWHLQEFGASGQAAYDAVVKMIRLRREFRPYVLEQMGTVSRNGTPLNRPLSFDFPEDARVWQITDQFMFGPKYMVAPVYRLGSRSRSVYFPRAKRCSGWQLHAKAAEGTAIIYQPGNVSEVSVPFDALALFECLPAAEGFAHETVALV